MFRESFIVKRNMKDIVYQKNREKIWRGLKSDAYEQQEKCKKS